MAKAKSRTTKAKTKKTKAKQASARSAKRSAVKVSSRAGVRSKKAVAKRPTKRDAVAKRASRSKARTSRAAASRAAKTGRSQRVAISHYNNADFETGLRAYAEYRDFGFVEATDGLVRAHVLRFTAPCDPAEVSKMHFHDTQFQMVYVLKGWVKTELEGQGEVTMRQGSTWTQPPQIKHKINDYSEDCELLEVILPADFGTVELTA